MGSLKVMSLLVMVALSRPADATYKTTRFSIGPTLATRDFVDGGGLNSNMYYVFDMPIFAPATATGSATELTNNEAGIPGTKYAAICIPNPLRHNPNGGTGSGKTYINTGTATVIRLSWGVRRNPNAAGGDIGFVDSCESGTGEQLVNNACTGTKCLSTYVTGTAQWSGDKYLKVGLRKDPTSSFRARLALRIEDNPAE